MTYELKDVAFEESCREGTVVESNYCCPIFTHIYGRLPARGRGARYKQYKVSVSLVDILQYKYTREEYSIR